MRAYYPSPTPRLRALRMTPRDKKWMARAILRRGPNPFEIVGLLNRPTPRWTGEAGRLVFRNSILLS